MTVVREEWRVVDRWWTEEPVDRRYFEVVLESDRTLWVSVRTVRQDAAGRRIIGWRAADETWLDPVREATATGPYSGRVIGPDRDDAVVIESYATDADGSIRPPNPEALEYQMLGNATKAGSVSGYR